MYKSESETVIPEDLESPVLDGDKQNLRRFGTNINGQTLMMTFLNKNERGCSSRSLKALRRLNMKVILTGQIVFCPILTFSRTPFYNDNQNTSASTLSPSRKSYKIPWPNPSFHPFLSYKHTLIITLFQGPFHPAFSGLLLLSTERPREESRGLWPHTRFTDTVETWGHVFPRDTSSKVLFF